MSNLKQFRIISEGTLLWILVFFSISFITVLTQISPFHYYREHETYNLAIGFPFKYYEQFWLRGSDIPNSGWFGHHLFYDCMITWLIVAGQYTLYKKRKLSITWVCNSWWTKVLLLIFILNRQPATIIKASSDSNK